MTETLQVTSARAERDRESERERRGRAPPTRGARGTARRSAGAGRASHLFSHRFPTGTVEKAKANRNRCAVGWEEGTGTGTGVYATRTSIVSSIDRHRASSRHANVLPRPGSRGAGCVAGPPRAPPAPRPPYSYNIHVHASRIARSKLTHGSHDIHSQRRPPRAPRSPPARARPAARRRTRRSGGWAGYPPRGGVHDHDHATNRTRI
jgi:hypothetical protein